jgi:hypothetical protein
VTVPAAKVGDVVGVIVPEQPPTNSHPNDPPVRWSGSNCPQYPEYGHALHLYTMVSPLVGLMTLTRSSALYLDIPPPTQGGGHPPPPDAIVGEVVGIIDPEQYPTRSHACCQ